MADGTPPSQHSQCGAGYTGVDRRHPVTAANLRAQILRTFGAVLIAIALWSIAAVFGASSSKAGMASVISLSHSMTGALLLASAALAFAVWRITGTSRAACAVVGLALAGISAPAIGILSRAARSGTVRPDLVEMFAALTGLGLIACIVAALILPPVIGRMKPLGMAALAMTACILSVVAILSVDGVGRESGRAIAVTSTILVTNAALWAAVGSAYLVVGRRRRRRIDSVIGVAILAPVIGATGRAIYGPISYQSNLIATGLAFSLACAVAGAATMSLWRLHTGNGTRMLRVTGELYGARTDLADLESDHARRLHDARNSIFAIAGAAELLTHQSGYSKLDPEHLQRMITTELDHLGHLLNPAFRPPAVNYSAAEILEPFIAAYRAQGLAIDANVNDCPIFGRRETVANAVANILTNARVHAPGAHIWITARSVVRAISLNDPIKDDNDAAAYNGYDAVRITIADDGPGIPTSERDTVLLPGVRGSATNASSTAGSGLGLASAAQALSEVGGTLRISERKGGGTMVTLTIPARTIPARTIPARLPAHSRDAAPGRDQLAVSQADVVEQIRATSKFWLLRPIRRRARPVESRIDLLAERLAEPTVRPPILR